MAIARVALPVATFHTFDYWIPDGLPVTRGSVVRVRLAGRRSTGVVVDIDSATDYVGQLQPVDEIVDLAAVPEEILELAQFASRYYQAPPGLALALATPPLPPRARRTRAAGTDIAVNSAAAVAHAAGAALSGATQRCVLNVAQQAAADAITGAAGGFAQFMLQGVTGSGKTEVYLAAAEHAIAKGGQVLILVPEINLTPQFEQRVRGALPMARAVTLHSGLAGGARYASWRAAARGETDVVLGTRLAVFTPMPRLALIVVDEEHDDSFKQQDGVRYHARDLAAWRAQYRGVPIVLGSATPSLDTWERARAGRLRTLMLGERADPRAQPPRVTFVPVRGSNARDGIAVPLWDALGACLQRGEQAMLFINRRGYAPSLKCASCAWESQCPRCSARLVVHRQPDRMRCHHCGHAAQVPRACPSCGNVDLVALGFGTQRLEQAVRAAFPDARVARVDRDTTRTKGAFAAVRQQVEDRELDILVGTQMLAKGHDFPRLTLVGVLGADNALYSADFRATERLGALLIQVTGRAGRAGLPGAVVVQTDFPEQPVYRALAAHDYAHFADQLLDERRAAQLPPASRVAMLVAEAHVRVDVDHFLGLALERARELAHALSGADRVIEIFPPVPAAMPRRAGLERGQMLVQSPRRAPLQAFLPHLREALAALPGARVRWAIDVDPTAF